MRGSTGNKRRIGIGTAAAAALLVVGLSPVTATAATPNQIILDVEGDAYYGTEGDIILIGEETVPAALVGMTCAGEAQAENDSSVRQGTDFIAATGTTQVVFENVESGSGLVVPASGPVVLGPTITLSVRLGPDGVASGGGRVVITCGQVTPPPTTVVATTSPPSVATTSPAGVATTRPAAPTTSSVQALPPPAATATTAPAQALTTTGALPETGSSSVWPLLGVAALLLLAGTALRKRAASS